MPKAIFYLLKGDYTVAVRQGIVPATPEGASSEPQGIPNEDRLTVCKVVFSYRFLVYGLGFRGLGFRFRGMWGHIT